MDLTMMATANKQSSTILTVIRVWPEKKRLMIRVTEEPIVKNNK